MYDEQGGQGRMDVLRGLEPLPTVYRRQALAEAVPGVMPQLAHLALENGRSSKADMNLWLQAHRPKTGKLDGDANIEREALANLETSDVFRAVTAPLRMGGSRPGELMLDEFRRGPHPDCPATDACVTTPWPECASWKKTCVPCNRTNWPSRTDPPHSPQPPLKIPS